MEGKHGKIDMICPSFVTPFEPGKEVLGCLKHIYFCPVFLLFDINTYS